MEHDETTWTNAQLSKHALARGQQRGIRWTDRETVLRFGDREVPAGGGCYRLSISSRQLRLLISQGTIPPQLGERCSRLVLVTDGSRVITNYKQDL